MSQYKFAKPILFLTLGYPGAGKSFFARQFADELDLVHVSSDRLRFELFEQPTYSKVEHELILRLMDYMTEEFLKRGVSVIYDANVNRLSYRRQKKQLAEKFGAKALIIWVQTDQETAFERAANRDRRKPDDKYTAALGEAVFERLANEIQAPSEFEPYIVISGKHLFKTQLRSVVKKLMVGGYLVAETQEGTTSPTEQSAVTRPQEVRRTPVRIDFARRNINR